MPFVRRPAGLSRVSVSGAGRDGNRLRLDDDDFAAIRRDDERVFGIGVRQHGERFDKHISVLALTGDDVERLAGLLECLQRLIHGNPRLFSGNGTGTVRNARADGDGRGLHERVIADACAVLDGVLGDLERIFVLLFDDHVERDAPDTALGAQSCGFL